jgi:hypothetical protein
MRHTLALIALLLLVLHCNPELAPPSDTGSAPADDAAAAAPLTGDDGASPGDDAGTTFDPWADAPSSSAADAAASVAPDSDASDSAASSAPDGACSRPLGAGDLAIDELMIEAVAGTGDYGEWLEIESTLGCAVDLLGLHGETADGAKIRTFDVADDLWLPAGATFVVADSEDPTLNHQLPGLVLAWSGHPGDVLRNAGGTVTLRLADTIVDTVTWPAYKRTVGVSIEFPASCLLTSRGDFSTWQSASSSWFPGFYGTPNAPNTDVTCP